MENLTNLSTLAYWHRESGEIVPLRETVGIGRISDGEDGSTVSFIISPKGLEFARNVTEGFVEVRFDAIPFDNPFAGKKFCTIYDIHPVTVVVENLAPLKFPSKELIIRIKVRCELDWDILFDWEKESDNED